MAAIQLTSPLILNGDPTLDNHPATKQYAEYKATHILASGFSSGLLNTTRLPALTGDIVMAAGSGTISLSTKPGLADGVYTRLVLDSRGRVKSASQMTEADIDNLDWSKITTGKPTTAAGYGITDVIGLSGGTITGTLNTTAVPIDPMHLVNKGFVDSMITASGENLSVGDVVRKGYLTTPTGFLRTNGASVSKTTYSALYSVIGDTYQNLYDKGVEAPYLHQSAFGLAGDIGTGSGSIGITYNTAAFYQANPLTVFVTKNFLYALFYYRYYDSGLTKTIQFFKAALNPDGSIVMPLQPVPVTGLPTVDDITTGQAENFFYNNKVWICTSNKIYRSAIDTNGNISALTLMMNTSGMTAGTRYVVIKNRVYVIDYDFTATTGALEIGYSVISSNDTLGAFTSLGTINVNAVKGSIIDCFVHLNKLFVIVKNGTTLTAWYAAVNSDATIGSWNMGPVATSTIMGVDAFYLGFNRFITTANGIFTVYNADHTVIRQGYSDQQDFYPLKKIQLVTDANGIPSSWAVTQLSSNNAIGGSLNNFIVKDRFYISLYFYAKYVSINGGLNDYTSYYDGSLSQPDPVNFKLPDFTSKETFGTGYFIKT